MTCLSTIETGKCCYVNNATNYKPLQDNPSGISLYFRGYFNTTLELESHDLPWL